MIHEKDKYNNKTKGVRPKNRVYCPECRRQKMKFNTEKEANDFIRWNGKNFDEKAPLRVYWCEGCCAYHITARPIGNVGVTVNMTLPYLTDALEKDKVRVVRTVKAIYNVLNILKQPSGYYGKTGLGKCKSILDSLNYSNNPYYVEERKKIYEIVEQQRAEYKDVWMKKKYCKLVKLKLYSVLCDLNHDEQYNVGKYDYNLAYILYLANNDGYDLNGLPELFLEEWETLFKASPVSKYLVDKMTSSTESDETIKNNPIKETLSEGEANVPGIQVSD